MRKPFPKIGEVIHFIIKAFDMYGIIRELSPEDEKYLNEIKRVYKEDLTKLSIEKLDEVVDNVLYRGLDLILSNERSVLIKKLFSIMFDNYKNMILNVQTDILTRKNILEIIIPEFFMNHFYVCLYIIYSNDSYTDNMLEQITQPKNDNIIFPIKVILDWWIESSDYNQLSDLTRELDKYDSDIFDIIKSEITTAESNYRSFDYWINNDHLPRARSIIKLGAIEYEDDWTENNKEVIVTALLFARFIQYSFNEILKIWDIKEVVKLLNNNNPLNTFGKISEDYLVDSFKNLSYINIKNKISQYKQHKKIDKKVYDLFIQLYENTLLKEEKDQDVEAKADMAYKRLKNLYSSDSLSLLKYRRYHINLCRARYYVLKGNHKKSLDYYIKAFKDGKYAAGSLLKEIIREGITLASYLNKKRDFKKFYKWALLYSLFEDRYKDIEEYIYHHQKKQYYSIFPPKYYYSSNSKKEKTTDQQTEFIINLEEWEKKSVDKRNPNRTTKFGSYSRTQLMIFSSIGQIDKVEKLLSIGADPAKEADDGATALILSLQNNNTEIASILLDQDLGKSIFAHTKKTNITALQAAIDLADVKIVNKIIKKNNKVVNQWCSLNGEKGISPLYYVINCIGFKLNKTTKEDFIEALKTNDYLKRLGNALFDNEIEKSYKKMTVHPEFKGFATKYEHMLKSNFSEWHKIVQLLLDRGADPNEKHYNDFTPVLLSAELGDIEAFKLLMKYRGKITNLAADNSSVLSLALVNKQFKFVIYLLDNFEVDRLINHPSGKYGYYPIHNAVGVFLNIKSGEKFKLALESLDKLLSLKPDINVKDKQGETPLSLAFKTKNDNIIKKIIEAGGGNRRSSGIITLY